MKPKQDHHQPQPLLGPVQQPATGVPKDAACWSSREGALETQALLQQQTPFRAQVQSRRVLPPKFDLLPS